MSLTVVIRDASNLPNLDSMGTSDPYVSVYFQGEKQKTAVQKSNLSPEWGEELVWSLGAKLPRPDEVLEIHVKDYERIGWNKLMGKTIVPLRNILQGTSGTLDLDQVLLDSSDQPTTGRLRISVMYSPPGGNAKTAGKPGQVSGSNLSPSAKSTTSIKSGFTSTDATDSGISMDDFDGSVSHQGGMPQTQAGRRGRNRDTLSNVNTKFQIRVLVIEARQLLGEDLHPVCRVSLDNHSQQTRVSSSSTCSPWFDQLFFFHEQHLPQEFMAKFLEFKVCNSRVLRSGSVIGAFKCEVGQIYDHDDCGIINRWLVLAHPDEPTPTIQGYLKVSIVVLGPGDVCPDLKATRDEADDVESNLLWSSGVHLQPATFTLTVYLAQNLPRMDSGTMQTLKELFGFGKASKELVDPYLIGEYAGRDVQTRILYTNDNPEFRQKVHLGFLFPSMCNNFKLTLMDWDRLGHDDVIGSAVIPINSISASGDNGYLPTFGPSFISIYGPRREWELFEGKVTPSKVGVGEECAYRGRVLVSLKTHVGEYPPLPTTDLNAEEFNKVQTHRSTRNFVVLVHLTHVGLIRKGDLPLELEVSMGNFGNKLENSLLPSPSSTHPCNPLYDGCRYYYLPWGNSSPLITLQSQWEDITHRLFTSNQLMAIAKELEKDLKSIEELKHIFKNEPKNIENLTKKIVYKLQEKCNQPLPPIDPVRHTETSLDSHLRQRRQQHLKAVVNTCKKLLKEATTKAIEELWRIVNTLKELADDPQCSLPDIFLWLMCGTERVAYVRLSAQSVLHAHDANLMGPNAGKFQSMTLKIPEHPSGVPIGGVVRASVWLGREEEAVEWWAQRQHLQLTVYAETYENQAISAPGSDKWVSKGAFLRRPPYSDADGLRLLPKDCFSPCSGWGFQGEWFVDPDPSIKYSNDAGHSMFVEEVFEQQIRVPGGAWLPAPTQWGDARGDPASPRDEMVPPDGWQWRDVWTTDVQRAVDADGWEYTVQKGVTGWSPQQKLYHVFRRRRWIRERTRMQKGKKDEESVEGWEYACLFSSRFHSRQRMVDTARRRRWRRKMVPLGEAIGLDTPRIAVKEDVGDEKSPLMQVTCPRQYVVSAEVYTYQLRAHIYQARELVSGDKTGFSDAFAIVSFCNSTQQTERQHQTLSPKWDQTLIFDNIEIAGRLLPEGGHEGIAVVPADTSPPDAVVEIFDWDARGEPDFLGRAIITPTVQKCETYQPTKLQWYQLQIANGLQGEMLCSFELVLGGSGEGGLPMPPVAKSGGFMVPFGIRPLLQKTRIEILCWGVRNMSTFELQSVTRPSIEFECGGQRVTSTVMNNCRQNPNFDSPHLVLDVELPKESAFVPPLTLRVMDHRSFGSKPIVANAAVHDLFRYNVDLTAPRDKTTSRETSVDYVPPSKKACGGLHMHQSHRQESAEPGTTDTEIDWWAKFYASTSDQSRHKSYLQKGYEKLEILKGNLEQEPKYHSFKDLMDTIPLVRGKGNERREVGEFKGTLRMYPLPPQGSPEPLRVLSSFPSPTPHEVHVRVYVLAAEGLAPKDTGGSSDPYVMVSLGKQKCSGRDEAKSCTLNPLFGKMYEVSGTLPMTKDLVIQVWDKDKLSSDDLIGETCIDLENRFLSRHRATIGLPKQFHVTGPNMWRDYQLPSEILMQAAECRGLETPSWNEENSLAFNNKTYFLAQFEPPGAVLPPSLGCPQERLSLHVLHASLPLVPEHVEARPLHHPERPGLPQGSLLLWVDLFPTDVPLTAPVDITPRKPNKYFLRVCIYNVYEVPLQERSFAGEQMSDVYVKGWMQGTDVVHKTDIHYRCLDGDANFNWRLLFPFEYLEAEQSMVVKKKKSHFSSDTLEEKRPPLLTLQLWDNDLILRDDYLSEMTLDLCRLPKPAKKVNNVDLSQVSNTRKVKVNSEEGSSVLIQVPTNEEELLVNLFEVKRVFGYFPFTRVLDGQLEVAGKLEAELEVLTEEEAKLRPSGQGRDKPNANPMLPEPNRPATSFLWFTSPLKSFRHIFWKNYKWGIITFLVLFFLFLFVFLLLYSLPGATIDYLIGVE